MDQPAPVIWMRPEQGARGPKATYRRDDVAAVAVRVADAEGIDAVSMRRIATELGVGVASLYRYVLRKDEVHELMTDAVMAELAGARTTGDWRADLRRFAHLLREVSLRHPWLPALAAGRLTHGPYSLRWTELTLAAFDGTGLGTDDMLLALGTLFSFVRGHVQAELAEQEAIRRSGLSNDEWLTQQGEYGPAIMNNGAYPRFTRVMIEAETPHAADRLQQAFESGLDRVLTGLSATIPEDVPDKKP
ncbi:TetR/AcrR family transcriptional regulator [Amycolatopsis saalfeldensis]|uniref:Regulatory protein, tetR family n=1 Tax=Amycolatopsis saalfeldensis TaxID=394193 RepID=A0A1H8Y7P0_9PSEU|nr:TetR/AcrR family transcriptional regulator C-terminal domain-containing protein [Amycolatopsis saalfeldensis]SEP47528.1 regulatory protein, tetR family [Amycolatopsis saalfeldensis]